MCKDRSKTHLFYVFLLDNGLSQVCMPSAALQALVPCVDNATMVGCSSDGVISNNENMSEINVLNRPSMAFIVEAHNLDDLKWAMKHAVRKAACRSYALQVSYKYYSIIL